MQILVFRTPPRWQQAVLLTLLRAELRTPLRVPGSFNLRSGSIFRTGRAWPSEKDEEDSTSAGGTENRKMASVARCLSFGGPPVAYWGNKSLDALDYPAPVGGSPYPSQRLR